MLAVLSLLLCLGDTYSGSSVPCGNCTDLDSAALLQSHRAALRKENALLQTDGQEVHEDITNVAPHNLGRYDYFEACSKSTPLSTLEHNFSIKVKMPHVCPDGTRLQKETAAGIVVTGCCSIASTWCGGCEEQDGAKESCKSCQGGYVLEGGHCIRCQDGPEVENCFKANCSQDAARTACCKCGGGERKATDFKYVVESLVRGATKVKGYPSPRTKGTYTVSEACQHKLDEVGLAIRSNGDLYLTADYLGERYTESHFEFQCTITSEQPGGLTTTAVASFVSNEIAYKYPVLVPKEDDHTSYELVSNLPHHCDLKWVAIQCSPPKPISDWISLDKHTGDLDVKTVRPDDSTTTSNHKCFLSARAYREGHPYSSTSNGTNATLLLQSDSDEDDGRPFGRSRGRFRDRNKRERRGEEQPTTAAPTTAAPTPAPSPSKSARRGSSRGGRQNSPTPAPAPSHAPAPPPSHVDPVPEPEMDRRTARRERRFGRRDDRRWWGCRDDLTGAVQFLAPFQWKGMQYGSASATVGHVAPALAPKEVPMENRLAPFRFSIACQPSIPGGSFAPGEGNFGFDIFTGDGTIDGIHAFNMDISTGIVLLDLSESEEFIKTLDFATSHEVRRSIHLQCTAFGHYEYYPYAIGHEVLGEVKLSILDTTCWQKEDVALVSKDPQASRTTEGECRSACRYSVHCWAYQFEGNSTCYFAGIRCDAGDPSCQNETVLVKYACEQGKLCVELVTDQWYLNGQYSEVTPSTASSTAPVFLRSPGSWKEQLYLTDYDASFGADFDCTTNSSVILRPSPDANKMFGTPLACITPKVDRNPKQAVISYTTNETAGVGMIQLCGKSCSTTGAPALTKVGIEGVDMNYDVEVLALGDPSTALPRDYWLHPCQCFPELYGVKRPVTQESFNDVPPGSGNRFKPSHYRVSSGALTCSNSNLIYQTTNTTLQGEVTQTDCQTLCETEPGCKYYFIGTASQSQQCRLYSSCEHLIQEQILAGSLFANGRFNSGNLTYCRIADPDKCYSVTMRRTVMGGPAESPSQNLPAPEDFAFYDVATQCDMYLLLGGSVTSCGKLTYAKVDSHSWTGKKHLPESLSNGAGLTAECWSERYAAISPEKGQPANSLLCVQGHLVWSSSGGEAAPLACGSCIQINQAPYWTLQTMDKQEIYFPQKLQLKVEILPPMSVLGLYTVKPQTCDRQVFKKDGTNDCLEADGGGLTLKACKVPPLGQLLNPESLPLLLESTYAKAGLLVPESNTSGTTPEADMFYGALAGIKFMQDCGNGAVQSFYFPAKQLDSEGKGVTAVTMAASCTYSDVAPGTSYEKIVQLYGTRFDSAGSSSLPGNVNWALTAFPDGTVALTQRSNEYSQLWGRFRVGAAGGILEMQGQMGQCLTHNNASGNGVYNVTLEPCNSSLDTQQWRFDSNQQHLLYDISGGTVAAGLLFVDVNDNLRAKVCVGVNCQSTWAAWVKWVLELPYNQDAPAKCGDGEVMTKIDKQEYRMIITCSKLRTEGSCIHKETPQIDVSSSYINNANNLFNTITECPTGYAMQFWKTQTFGDQATSINFAYTCCAAGSGFRSATVWQEPNTSHFESWEGVYCPHGRGDAGFLDYVQRTIFGFMNGSKVELNKSSGKWCLDATGTCLQGGLFDSPAAQDTWQANPVSNFDGDCAKGQVTQPLLFKKEQLSSHPEIVYFGAEKETESSEEEPFECSPTKSESLPANHPCKAVWEKKITMEQVFDCFDRETWRQERLRHLSSLMYNQKSKTEMREAYSSGACASIPDIQSTAYIPGNILTPGRVCQVQNELVFLNKKFAEGDIFEELEKSLFESSNADCAGTKLGLAKVFCDLHCIKAAIAEGDEDLTSSKQKIYYRKKGRKHRRRQKYSLLQSADAADASNVDDANATSASFTQGSRSQSSAAVVSQRAAVFAQRTGKLLQLRQQAVKAHEDAVLQVKERQRHLTMSTAQQAQEHSARQLLLDLDSTWWSIRSTIDSHLHSVRQFQSAFSDAMTLLEGFSQQCSVKWHDVLKGYDRLSSTETEFQQGLLSMWLEVLPKAGLLSDQLLHGDAFSRLLEFDANSLDVPSIMASSKEEDNLDTLSDCVDAMASRLQTALSQGFAHQMLLQVRTVFAELASLRDRFHFEGMGEPEDSKLLPALLQQAEEAHETARSILMPKLVQQLATQSCDQEISVQNPATNSSA